MAIEDLLGTNSTAIAQLLTGVGVASYGLARLIGALAPLVRAVFRKA
jgi:hypothetical protein